MRPRVHHDVVLTDLCQGTIPDGKTWWNRSLRKVRTRRVGKMAGLNWQNSHLKKDRWVARSESAGKLPVERWYNCRLLEDSYSYQGVPVATLANSPRKDELRALQHVCAQIVPLFCCEPNWWRSKHFGCHVEVQAVVTNCHCQQPGYDVSMRNTQGREMSLTCIGDINRMGGYTGRRSGMQILWLVFSGLQMICWSFFTIMMLRSNGGRRVGFGFPDEVLSINEIWTNFWRWTRRHDCGQLDSRIEHSI